MVTHLGRIFWTIKKSFIKICDINRNKRGGWEHSPLDILIYNICVHIFLHFILPVVMVSLTNRFFKMASLIIVINLWIYNFWILILSYFLWIAKQKFYVLKNVSRVVKVPFVDAS